MLACVESVSMEQRKSKEQGFPHFARTENGARAPSFLYYALAHFCTGKNTENPVLHSFFAPWKRLLCGLPRCSNQEGKIVLTASQFAYCLLAFLREIMVY